VLARVVAPSFGRRGSPLWSTHDDSNFSHEPPWPASVARRFGQLRAACQAPRFAGQHRHQSGRRSIDLVNKFADLSIARHSISRLK
jgi:hypothetical protein